MAATASAACWRWRGCRGPVVRQSPDAPIGERRRPPRPPHAVQALEALNKRAHDGAVGLWVDELQWTPRQERCIEMAAPTAEPSFVELFTPKLVTVLREGYRFRHLKADAVAGLTVAIVALPLSMALAIASGRTPDRGLYTAIVGGFLISALGGSRFQIGGPAGAFIVLVASTVERHGVDGLMLATMLSGLVLLAVGLLRLGTFIKYIPYPVTVGFTAGIAVIIFASQIRELLGLTLDDKEPGPFIPKILALGGALPSINPIALVITALTVFTILGVR